MNKQKGIIAFILIALVLVSTACINTRHYVHKYSIRTSYKEWIDQIGIFSHDNLKVSGYREENNKIELELEYENGITGYKELCDVVNAHNKFVDKNPDYFPSDIDIHIYNMKNFNGSGFALSYFFNRKPKGTRDYSMLKSRDTAKIQYEFINMERFGYENIEYKDVVMDIPILILDCSYAPGYEAYAFLAEFNNAEQLVIDYHTVDYNQKKACEYIQKILPNVEIYSVVVVDGQEQLKRIN